MSTTSLAPSAGAQPPSRLQMLQALSFLKDLKIGTKLTVGFGILVALTFVSAIVSYLGSGEATAKINLTDDVRVPTALAAARAQTSLLQMQSDVRGYLALGDKEYQDSLSESTQDFKDALSELDRLSPNLDSQNQKRLADLKFNYTKWEGLPAQLFELRNDQIEREPAYRILATDGVRLAGRVLIDTSTLIDAQGQREATVDNLGRLTDMAKFQGNFAAMLSALRGYVTTRNRAFRQEFQVNLADNKISWDKLSSKKSTLTANQQKSLDNIGKNRDDFLKLPDQIFRVLESDQWRQDLYLFKTNALPLADEMQRLLNEITTDQQTVLKADLAAGRANLDNTNRLILAGGLFALLIGVAMAYVSRENIAGPISRLTQVADRIRGGDLAAQAMIESKDETGVLAATFNNMTGQLRQTLMQVRKEKNRADSLLDVVIPIGAELASEKNFNLLLEKMLMEAKGFCRADGGTLYLKTEKKELRYVILRHDAQQIALGGTTGRDVNMAPMPLFRPDGERNDRLVPARVALTGTPINVSSLVEASQFDLSDTRVYTDTCANSLLALPLKNAKGDVLGVLQLMDAQDPETGKTVMFDANLQEMMESFSLLAVAALEAYIREQSLQDQIQQLRIEIDEVKRQKQVSEIVDTDFFQSLTEKARQMREQRKQGKDKGAS